MNVRCTPRSGAHAARSDHIPRAIPSCRVASACGSARAGGCACIERHHACVQSEAHARLGSRTRGARVALRRCRSGVRCESGMRRIGCTHLPLQYLWCYCTVLYQRQAGVYA
eukprot:IDg19817t1